MAFVRTGAASFDSSWRGPLAVAFAVAALAALAACGSDNDATTPTTPTTTTTTTTQPAGQVIISGSELVPARQVFWKDLTTTKSGRIDVTIDYNPSINNVPMWLSDRQCSPQFFEQDRCDFLVKSVENIGQKTMFASNVPAGTYTFFVANDGPGDVTLTYSVTLTPSASAAGRIEAGKGGLLPRR
jgi:hypothetical protein